MPDSPQPSNTPTTAANPSAAVVEESPVHSYISNLSPIQPVKPAPVAQGFPGLNSPPFVFTSPRTNPRSKPSFLVRPQFLQSPSAELSGMREIFKGVADRSRISDIQSSSGLIPSDDKVSDSESSVHDQAATPSTCADEFLAEIVNVNPSHSGSSEQSDDTPQLETTETDPKESVAKVETKDGLTRDVNYVDAEQAGVYNEGKLSSDLEPVEAEEKRRNEDLPSDQYPEVERDSFANHALHQQQENSKYDDSSAKHESSAMNSESLSPRDKLRNSNFKAGQNQRGMRRRCLQFEDAQQITSKGLDSINTSGDVNCLRSPIHPAGLEIFDSSSTSASHVNRQLAKSIQPNFCPQTGGNIILKVPKPSGIGLHLNSIVNSIQCGTTVSMKSMESGSFSVRGKKSVSLLSCHSSDNSKSYSLSFNEAEHISTNNENKRHEGDEPIGASSATALTPCSVKPLNSVSLKSTQQQSIICEKRKYNTVNNNSIAEECGQSSQEKKRKKMSDPSDGDGCKRCNCKKTKCLKLYCDCFAAGIYCAGDCACQGCFNRPDYEDTVLETRQQIESRNPLAFAPKIIQKVTEPNANGIGEIGTRSTPSSGRHKRGCNCKKSMCLKKYCECYQANVGCSDGCRCDGCKNVYGRKEEYGKVKHLVGKRDQGEVRDVSFPEKLELAASGNDILQTDPCHSHNLTPITPPFEHSDHGKDASKSWFSLERFLPLPESATFFESFGLSPVSSGNCDDHGTIQESSKEILDIVPFDKELDYRNSITVKEISPRYHGPGSVGHYHPLLSPQDWATRSQTQQISGDGSHFSIGSSLHWHRSISPENDVGGNKFNDTIDYSGLHNALEGETPDILKETLPPCNTVKVSSPNKKRVSPPHSHMHGVGCSPSASLRSCRKFILQGVPSFPPLTPCIESKSDANQGRNDSRNCTGSK